MCIVKNISYIFGLFQHTLLEAEAENVRMSMLNMLQRVRSFAEEVNDWTRKLTMVVQKIEGGVQVVTESDGHQRPIQVYM